MRVTSSYHHNILDFSQGHRRESSVPQFAPPVVKLDHDTSLRQPMYVPALTGGLRRGYKLGGRRHVQDGEGSSTESQADLRDVPAEVAGYVDHVVDAQYPEYVVIEASPRQTGEEVTVILSVQNVPSHMLSWTGALTGGGGCKNAVFLSSPTAAQSKWPPLPQPYSSA